MNKFLLAFLLVALLTTHNGVVNGQSICNTTVSQLMSCQPAVTPPTPSAPTAACCTVVKQADLQCLCSYKNTMPMLGMDPNLAFQLPQKCGLPPTAC